MPISAQARGQRRVLFRHLDESAAQLRQIYRSDRAKELVRAWALKRGRGRLRAQQHLVALFGPLARLRLVTDTYLGWLFLSPAEAGVHDDDPDDPGITQYCIAAFSLLVGVLPGRCTGSILSCRWSLEFTEHAVGRLLERSPTADPALAMIAAHDALMRTGTHMPPETFFEFWVPGRAWGAFACRPLFGTMDGKGIVYVRARTWLDADMLTDQYVVTDALPGERFGETILMPGPLISQEYSDAIKRMFPPSDA